MKTFGLIAVAAASLSLAACGDSATNADATATTAEDTAAMEGDAAMPGATSTTTVVNNWPADARIVEEGGVTYRIDADGTRVRLGDSDPRIVVENGVNYRVDPGGARIRLDERGLGVDVDPPRVEADTPDIEVETN